MTSIGIKSLIIQLASLKMAELTLEISHKIFLFKGPLYPDSPCQAVTGPSCQKQSPESHPTQNISFCCSLKGCRGPGEQGPPT